MTQQEIWNYVMKTIRTFESTQFKLGKTDGEIIKYLLEKFEIKEKIGGTNDNGHS